MEIKKLVVDIYLKGDKKPSYSAPLIQESDIDQFYSELNDSNPVMEFGDFYFAKSEFRCARLKEVKENK